MVPAVGIEPTSPPYEGVALPLSYAGLEPQVGIEPSSPAYKAGASPLCFPRRKAPLACSEECGLAVHVKVHAMKTAVCLALLTLTACAHTQPGIEVRTQTVYVPQLKPCPAKVPTRPDKLGELPSDANAALALVLGKLAAYSAPGKYADQASLYFQTCPPSPSTPATH